MGNSESSVDPSLSRSCSVKHIRYHSQSPTLFRDSSVRRVSNNRQCMTGEPMRRSKTCRVKNRNARRAVCVVTGLTLHQKALLTRKWNRMDRGTVYELGRRMFVNVFVENPHYLAYIDLKGEPNWANHINFKIHVQRFVTALIESMRHLREPSSACDVLRDFGANYATYPKRVSALYFERLANALNQVATQLQEGDHLELEKSISTSCSSMPTVRSGRSSDAMRTLLTRNSESQMESLKEESVEITISQQSGCTDHSHDDKSICPITVEAWTALSAYLANQIKFGYELEKMLQAEMSKLGLDSVGGFRKATMTLERPAQYV
uniref:GLOBIN domain-containing protein n=1 Tax=Heterorhabditis bacteriophora TaxID=37862 RepID=A0A1I7XNX5_HETBA